MSGFDEYYKKPLDGYDDSDCYYGKDDLEHAYNAGDENGYRRGVEDAARLATFGGASADEIRKLLTRG